MSVKIGGVVRSSEADAAGKAQRIEAVRVNPVLRAAVRKWLSLDGSWRLRLDPDDLGLAQGWAAAPIATELSCRVPGCIQRLPELAAAYPNVNGLQNGYLGTAWYETERHVSAPEQGQRLWLKLGGVAPAAHLWVNGHYVDYYAKPNIAAKWDITDFLNTSSAGAPVPVRVTVAIVEQELGLLGGYRFRGNNWSGLYRSVELEYSSELHAEDLWVRPRFEETNGKGKKVEIQVSGHLWNRTDKAQTVRLAVDANEWSAAAERKAAAEEVMLGGDEASAAKNLSVAQAAPAQAEADLELEPGAAAPFRLTMAVADPKLWSCDRPALYRATVRVWQGERLLDEQQERFGIRELKTAGAAIELNGEPLFIRGTGSEYASPTIHPLTDRDIIRARWSTVRAHGFDFFRFHTCMPTDEELDVADELGLIIASEVSLVSNFSKTYPFPKGLKLLESHIRQTRHYPSLGVYGLGNEGSQLMVHMREEYEHAEEGMAAVRRLAPDHLAMAAFGMQGELPALPNDVESPHLWSHEFRVAYDGLSRIPWELLSDTVRDKPAIVHEYGKFGVWPDPEEQKLYPEDGYRFPFGDYGRQALEKAGLGCREEEIRQASKRLSSLCNRFVMEEARRQPNVSGFVVWTFFRNGQRNGGFCDDLGIKPDHPPELYRLGCNSDVAILIDRSLGGRTFRYGESIRIGVSVSNFRGEAISEAQLAWTLTDSRGRVWLEGGAEVASIENGSCEEAAVVGGVLPSLSADGERLNLKVVLSEEGRAVSENEWSLWGFPDLRSHSFAGLLVHELQDRRETLHYRALLPASVALRDADSMLRGCRSWKGMDAADAFRKRKPQAAVTDRWEDAARLAFELGVPTVLLDHGSLPDAWYPGLSATESGPLDYFRQFTSFRAGWDQGNLATLVHDDPLFRRFPHEGFCDAHFYHMIQGAAPLRVESVRRTLRETLGSAADGPAESASGPERQPAVELKVLVRSVPRFSETDETAIVLQDPNAKLAHQNQVLRRIATEDRAYLLRVRAGDGILYICSLQVNLDAAGQFLLGLLLDADTADTVRAPRQ